MDLDRPAYEDDMLSDADLERYARQVIMPHIGEGGQERRGGHQCHDHELWVS